MSKGLRKSTYRKSFFLTPEEIDGFSDWLEECSLEEGVERQNRVRVRLLMEEVLLDVRSRLGEQAHVLAVMESRFKRPRLRLEIEGKAFNPLTGSDSELSGWDSSLRTAIGLSPQYSYDGICNVLRLSLPYARMNAVLRIAMAIAIGIACGLLGAFVLPEQMRQTTSDVLLYPIYGVWNRLLNAISGPVVFLTVMTTMLNTRGIEQRGGNSVRVIVRYFVVSIVVVAGALLCSLPFHPLSNVNVEVSTDLAQDLVEAVLRVVPSNVFDPFIESDTSQLLFLAFVLGYVLVHLGDEVPRLTANVREANMVGLQLAGWMSALVPTFVGAFLCLEFWQGSVGVLLGLWRPLVLAFVISVAVLFIMVLLLSSKMRVSPLLMTRKMKGPFVTALLTGSLDEAFGELQLSCTQLLGIDKGYAKEALPQGLVLYMPVSAIGTIVFTIYTAQSFGVQGNVIWYVSAVIMAVVVFVATPPVPGANLLAYVVLFSTLGIPGEALLDAMTFDVVFGIFAGAANQSMLQLEMMYQTGRFGLLNKKVLRKPLA